MIPLCVLSVDPFRVERSAMYSIFLPHEQKKLSFGIDATRMAAAAHASTTYPRVIFFQMPVRLGNKCWGKKPELRLLGEECKEIVDPLRLIQDVRRSSRVAA